MKRGELERKLKDLGWRLSHHGGRHDAWVNEDGTRTEYVPRHNEVNEMLARAILRKARSASRKGKKR